MLARTPEAPPGSRGLSLFLVPKFLLDDEGRPGQRNAVRTLSLEHKLGIHASPTCVLAYEDAVGWRIGEENRGLEYMFTMMNNARLNIGMQGVAIAERAYQQARDFARIRVQGQPLGACGQCRSASPIIHHPDVRRMLLWMRAATEAMRSLAYYAAAMIDRARRDPDPAERVQAQRRADLLIPVVKAWCTDMGVAVASTGIQVHGGMGYIEETGAAQYLRDARIAPIYEGTNGIQANDLVGRKLARDHGEAVGSLFAEIAATLAALGRGGQWRRSRGDRQRVARRARRRSKPRPPISSIPTPRRRRRARHPICSFRRGLWRLADGASGARRRPPSCRRRRRRRLSRRQDRDRAFFCRAFPGDGAGIFGRHSRRRYGS